MKGAGVDIKQVLRHTGVLLLFMAVIAFIFSRYTHNEYMDIRDRFDDACLHFHNEVEGLSIEVDSLAALVTPDAKRQAYVQPASRRIGRFLPPEKAKEVASAIWEVSMAFAPRTDLTTYQFAMLMEALAEHESGFRKDALSVSGVPGPWQCSYTLAKALAQDPVIYRYAVSTKRDLMDYEVSAWYGAAALSLFLDAYDQNLSRALLAWHDGEPITNRGMTTPAARHLRSNVLAILQRNKEEAL
jgi:hypothetical protein